MHAQHPFGYEKDDEGTSRHSRERPDGDEMTRPQENQGVNATELQGESNPLETEQVSISQEKEKASKKQDKESSDSEHSEVEKKSLTHADFWIPEEERKIYKEALSVLNANGIPYVISGFYAIYAYTGVSRKTGDLDILLTPEWVLKAAEALKDNGFKIWVKEPHWIAKASKGEGKIDLIYGQANGLQFIDHDWYKFSKPSILAGEQARMAPIEELVFHRLFITERHRHDVSDILHLFLIRGEEINWNRLLERLGEHWRLLLAQIIFFDYVYPAYRGKIPKRIRDELLTRALGEVSEPEGQPKRFFGSLVSRFSFAIDLEEWGLEDMRQKETARVMNNTTIQNIAN